MSYLLFSWGEVNKKDSLPNATSQPNNALCYNIDNGWWSWPEIIGFTHGTAQKVWRPCPEGMVTNEQKVIALLHI